MNDTMNDMIQCKTDERTRRTKCVEGDRLASQWDLVQQDFRRWLSRQADPTGMTPAVLKRRDSVEDGEWQAVLAACPEARRI